jgi:hypothetical protein
MSHAIPPHNIKNCRGFEIEWMKNLLDKIQKDTQYLKHWHAPMYTITMLCIWAYNYENIKNIRYDISTEKFDRIDVR